MKKFAYDLLSWLEDGAAWSDEVGLEGSGLDFEGDIRVCRYVLESEDFGLDLVEFSSSEDQLLLRRDLQE